MAQLVRAPPCHGGGREFESLLGRLYRKIQRQQFHIWDHSSAGRAPALQAGGHRFEPYWSHFTTSSVVICRSGGTGRRTGLKILRDLYSRTGSIPVCGILFEKEVLRNQHFFFYCLENTLLR